MFSTSERGRVLHLKAVGLESGDSLVSVENLMIRLRNRVTQCEVDCIQRIRCRCRALFGRADSCSAPAEIEDRNIDLNEGQEEFTNMAADRYRWISTMQEMWQKERPEILRKLGVQDVPDISPDESPGSDQSPEA